MVALAQNNNDHSAVTCVECMTKFVLFYNREDMVHWLSGSLPIQDAMPYLSSSERELLLSGICGDCFDKLFPVLDNNE